MALNTVARHAELPLFAAAKMWTYWKTLRTVVHPPEELNILWLVDPAACQFLQNREVGCEGGLLIVGVATCHHLSYVRTTEELTTRKLSSFSHANEVQATWLRAKWEQWDGDNR